MDLSELSNTLRYQLKVVAIQVLILQELSGQTQAVAGGCEIVFLRQSVWVAKTNWLEPKRQQPGRTKERSDKRTGREDRGGARRERRNRARRRRGAEASRGRRRAKGRRGGGKRTKLEILIN